MCVCVEGVCAGVGPTAVCMALCLPATPPLPLAPLSPNPTSPVRPDVLPPDVLKELSKLQDRIEPFPTDQVGLGGGEWGGEWGGERGGGVSGAAGVIARTGVDGRVV